MAKGGRDKSTQRVDRGIQAAERGRLRGMRSNDA